MKNKKNRSTLSKNREVTKKIIVPMFWLLAIIWLILIASIAKISQASCNDEYEQCCDSCCDFYAYVPDATKDPFVELMNYYRQSQKVEKCIQNRCVPQYEHCKRLGEDDKSDKKTGCFVNILK